MKILVKSGVEQLHLFEKENFPYFEAYLRGDEDLNEFLKTKMRLVAIHLPHSVEYQGQRHVVNFAGGGAAEEASFKKLKEIIEFSAQHGIQCIVIHLGFFNMLAEERWKVLDQVAAKFRVLDNKKVKICLENVPCWANICFENEPLLSSAEHFLYFKKQYPRAEATLDVDHLAINTVFNHYYLLYRERYVSAIDKKKFRLECIETEIQHETTKRKDFFRKRISEELACFLTLVKPALIHAVGSDYNNYRHSNGALPLLGEALPLNYKGTIKGAMVKDRIDHLSWIQSVPVDVYITLELLLRDDYDYISALKHNYRWLEKAWRKR